jgi:non-homologous end joining protein Ku
MAARAICKGIISFGLVNIPTSQYSNSGFSATVEIVCNHHLHPPLKNRQ